MTTRRHPQWTERDQPTTQLVDMPGDRTDTAELPPQDTQNRDYADWVNYYRDPLHAQLRGNAADTGSRLLEHGVDPLPIAQVIGNLLQTTPYPGHRLITVDDAASLSSYTAALSADFFDEQVRYPNGDPATNDFVPPLHFIRLATEHVNTARKLELADTVAYGIGVASLAPVVNISITRGEKSSPVYGWFGTTWRYGGRYYGEVLLEAAAVKLAAEARRKLGYRVRFERTHPVIAPYQVARTAPRHAYGAIALDLLNAAAGNSDPLAIYRPLWGFARSGATNEGARKTVRDIISRATDGQLTLEDLESLPYTPQGFTLAMLRQVEDACRLDARTRPSTFMPSPRHR